MSALDELKAALQEARTEAATLRIRVRQLEEKLVEVAAASGPVLRNPTTERCVGFEPHPLTIYADEFCVAPVYEAKPGEVARPRYCGRPRREHVTEPAGGPEQDRGAAALRPAGHSFLPTPFYPQRCDAKVDEDGRIRTCGRPREEHLSVRTSAKE